MSFFFFSFTNIGEQKHGIYPAWGFVTNGRGRRWGKRVGG
jgi:hypothetical protein